MKLICLGYMEERKWNEMPERDRTALMEDVLPTMTN